MKTDTAPNKLLKLDKESSKKEKFIVISLWIIALYFIIGGAASLIMAITAPSNYLLSLLLTAIPMLVLGIGLILKKKWSILITSFLSLIFIILTLSSLMMYPDSYLFNIISTLLGLFVYFITQHEISEKLYDVDFLFLHKVKKVIFWTLGMGVVGFAIHALYVTLFLDGTYRGFVVIYGTELFLGIGFIVGIVKALKLKRK